jgi:hypothetical protein
VRDGVARVARAHRRCAGHGRGAPRAGGRRGAGRPGPRVLPGGQRAGAGDADGALAALERTLQLGEGFLPPADLFAALATDPRFVALRERFAARLPSRTDGEIAFTLGDRLLIPEGIAYDPSTRTFYVGGIAHKGIFHLVNEWDAAPAVRSEGRS